MANKKAIGASTLGADQMEHFGEALAHVVAGEGMDEVVLGQAWVVGRNALVTCGHVVESFVGNPKSLTVKFPSLRKAFPIQRIKLHPDFARQQTDQFVKFDLALLFVEPGGPKESLAPLLFAYDRPISKNQRLNAIRFPVHLGMLTDAPEPVAQAGRLLGNLRKQDNFHLLHDLALSPGDSGAPLLDGAYVVAIHCGDTATLPGLNLPTTSIRLAVWVDSLKDLGVPQSARLLQTARSRSVLSFVLPSACALIASFIVSLVLFLIPLKQGWVVKQPEIMPIDVRFNQPVLGYALNERVQIDLEPRTDCHLYLFDLDESGTVHVVLPMPGFTSRIKSGQRRSVGKFGENYLTGRSKEKLHLVALISDDPLVKETYWAKDNPAGSPLTIDGKTLTERIHDFERLEPEGVLHIELDAPRAL